MFYAIAGAALLLLAYWIWGMRKMARMNGNPDQLVLAHLLIKAGSGEDGELVEFIGQQGWTSLRMKDNIAHALSLAERLFPTDEYGRARLYVNTQQARYSAPQGSPLRMQSGNEVLYRESKPAPPTPGSTASPQKIGSSDSPARDATPIPELQEPPTERQGFRANQFVVYPAHGVGQILAIEEQEIAGARLELFVINFMKDKMTLRVPTTKLSNVGIRKLSDPESIQEAYRVLNDPPQMLEMTWSAKAQEYEAKINSGKIVAIAEVVRDLHRSATGEGQSYSERQLYEAALDRLSREVAVVEHLTEEEAVKRCESLVIASAILKRSG